MTTLAAAVLANLASWVLGTEPAWLWCAVAAGLAVWMEGRR